MKGLMGPALSVLSLEAPQDPPVSPSPWGHRKALPCGYIPPVPPSIFLGPIQRLCASPRSFRAFALDRHLLMDIPGWN